VVGYLRNKKGVAGDPMIIEGNAVMNFDREGSTKVPAGFGTLRVLTYNPSSYEEVTN
jgi:hypothetical protein